MKPPPVLWMARKPHFLVQTLLIIILGYVPSTCSQEITQSYNVIENSGQGRFVGTVASHEGYTYTGLSDPVYISVDYQTGALTTLLSLDREVLPDHQIKVIISAENKINGSRYLINAIINVLDVNDNAPTFSSPSLNYTLQENFLPLQPFTLTATDPDKGKNGSIIYSLVSGNEVDGKWRLESNSESRNGLLSLESKVDREQTSGFRLVIQARDEGIPVRSSSIIVNVNIEDDNDNSPRFDSSHYSAEVFEDTTIGRVILQVHAEDDDVGFNAALVYSLQENSLFQINPRTGEISTKASLLNDAYVVVPQCKKEYCNTSLCLTVCIVELFVHDQEGIGTSKLRDQSRLKITVNDINDHAPSIVFRENPEEMSENAIIGSLVSTATIKDSDLGINRNVSLSIVSGDDENLFTVNECFMLPTYSLCTILTQGYVNVTTRSEFVLTLRASDRGNPSLSSTAQLRVNRIDANNHVPVFADPLYRARVSELEPVGSYVIALTATDKDEGENGRITYELSNGGALGNQFFDINSDTGLVTINSRLDSDQLDTSSLNFTVIARDHGSNVLTSSSELSIEIVDENDETPTFQQELYELNVKEGPTNYSLIKLTAIDRDKGCINCVRYRLHPDTVSLYGNRFSIQSQTGLLKLKSELDRETQSEYELKVIAYDMGVNQSLSSTVAVLINVTDENDNEPVFYPVVYFREVPSSAESGYSVASVSATDRDSGENSIVSYQLQRMSGPFTVNANTGEIRTNNALSEGTNYELKVDAVDGRGLKSEIPATVTISVASSNEPDISSPRSSYTFSVREDSQQGTPATGRVVGQAVATSTIVLKFYITSGDTQRVFNINQNTGEITTRTTLDREVQDLYELIVVAKGITKLATISVKIIVTDQNDNDPVFDQSVYNVRIPENSPLKSTVFLAQAFDADAGLNANLSYSISGQDVADRFTINSQTGAVLLQRMILLGDSYSMWITATDAGTSQRSSRAQLILTVYDVNDHSPVFDSVNIHVSVNESELLNHKITIISAHDADRDENARITYKLTGGVNTTRPEFGIFPDGSLYLAQPLDREIKDRYQLIVQASDHGYPVRSATAVIHVTVLDNNDNTPEFHQQSYQFKMLEGQLAGTYIGSVSAQDPDIGRNSDIMYFFKSTESMFNIDPYTGEITSQTVFDRERNSSFTLNVMAVDNGLTRLSSHVEVYVIIEDINDNSPEFSQSIYYVTISENINTGSLVYPLSAVDLDSGSNGNKEYRIVSGNEFSKFSINQHTGQILVQGLLDRERQDRYDLVVQVNDLGQPKLQSNATVVISISDFNDERPYFTQSLYSKTIYEDFPVNTPIIQLTATDNDIGINAQTTFQISYQDESERVFSIDEYSGEVFVVQPLDIETLRRYNLTIQVSNPSSTLSSQTALRIVLMDINDNKPQFVNFPTTVNVNENISTQQKVVQVTAIDNDIDTNNKRIKYTVVEQYPDNKFTINEDSGAVTITQSLDRETTQQYRVVIEAQDQAIPASSRLSVQKTMFIYVLDVNDNDPQFVSANAATVLENSVRGMEIYQARAIDADEGVNARVTYTLVVGNDKFEINTNTGLVKLKVNNIGYNPVKYQLTIRASDSAVNRRSSTIDVTVIVTASAVSGLQFTSSGPEHKLTVSEDLSVASPVTRLETNSQSARIKYYVTEITSLGQEQINYFKMAGNQLVTNRKLDIDTGFVIYFVEVWAMDESASLPNTAKTTIEVTLVDANDTPPRFNNTIFNIDILETFPIGDICTSVTARDPDLNTQLTYSFNPGSQYFQINNRGEIRVISALDREMISEHRLTVLVSDTKHTTQTLLRIRLVDVNDEHPTFKQPEYSLIIAENAQVDSEIGRVEAEDEDDGVGGQVKYRISSDWADGLFSVDSESGVIKLISTLDYETTPLYIVEVTAYDGGNPSLSSNITVYINIADINDNDPVFTPSLYTVSIPENKPVNSTIVTVYATDDDQGLNGEVIYSLADLSSIFSINPYTGNVTLLQQVNREKTTQYNISIIVSDRGEQSRSSTTVVRVTVTDINDETPRFPEPHVLHINENTPLNHVATVVQAVDDDLGDNSRLSYGVLTRQNLFTIDSRTGEIRLRQALDREVQSNYTVTLSVIDAGSPPLSSEALFTVYVDDYNDNTPQFNENQVTVIPIREDQQPGQVVLTLSAQDKDFGISAYVKYYIISGDPLEDFNLDQYSGQLSVSRGLDYERQKLYTLRIQAEDSGLPALYSTIDITINVQDWNDNPPVFLHSPYYIYLREETTLTTNLTQVTAVDRDSAPYNVIRYSLEFSLDDESDNSRGIFTIDENTGLIKAIQAVDREKFTTYHLIVNAVNQYSGSPVLSSRALVYVLVTDINDHAPKFDLPVYSTSFTEDKPLNTLITQVSASDLDVGDNSEVRYKLENNTHSDYFTINSDTGNIYTEKLFDRETQEQFIITVIAYDLGSPSLSSTTEVRVKIVDINDNSPIFPPDIDSSIQVIDTVSAGDFIIGLTANDPDLGSNGSVTYRLTGTDAQLFTISNNGVVTRSAQSTSKSFASFTVTATDGGNLSSSKQITVSFVSQSGNPPTITLSTNPITIQDTATAPKTVSRVRAQSGSMLGNLRIAGGNIDDTFSINDTGQIIMRKKVDYYRTQQFKLWIESASQSNPVLKSYVLLNVTVQDRNNHVPTFEKDLYIASTLEQQQITNPLTLIRVKVEDLDSGSDGRVTFAIESGNEENAFDLSSDGSLKLTKQLDRERQPQYVLVISATDGGGLSSTTMVIIRVDDINDNFPRFLSNYRWSVSEDAVIGEVISAVQANDADTGLNARIRYSLVSADVPFTVTESGNITVSGNLDREKTNEYNLVVRAADSPLNGGGLSATTTIKIKITDINDQSPVFIPNSQYRFEFTELQDAGTLVGRVQANDGDEVNTTNARVRYRLVSPNSFFMIDSHTGEMRSRQQLNFEPTGIHNTFVLYVEAHDLGTPSLTSQAMVNISILDANDHPPVFSEQAYFKAVPYNVITPGETLQVLEVLAEDRFDFGMNSEISYRLSGGNGSSLFSIDPLNGWINVTQPLTSRKNQYIGVQVTAEDSGIPAQSERVNVVFLVTEENRYRPRWVGGGKFNISLSENTATGNIGVITASDTDTGINSILQYSITSGNDENIFSLDKKTGNIFLLKSLDYETARQHAMNIEVKDSAFIPLTLLGSLTVNVIDSDDNAAEFDQSEYTAEVPENLAAPVSVITVTATDADSGRNAAIRYSIVGDQLAYSWFTIDFISGEITTTNSFDYEHRNEYVIIVEASNPYISTHVTQTEVRVKIGSANEFQPFFSPKSYTFDVREDAQEGYIVGTITAFDSDLGRDGIREYYLVGESSLAGFTLNRYTGELIVAEQLDREKVLSLTLNVMVKNPGLARGNETDTAVVIINLDDANDAPVFDYSSYNSSVSENQPAGEDVVEVRATDSDQLAGNREFSYSLESSFGKFRVDSRSGKLTTTARLDREDTSKYVVIVKATDTGSPPLTGQTIVYITVNDVNDNPPHFVPKIPQGYISENSVTGSRVQLFLSNYVFDDDNHPHQGPFTYQTTSTLFSVDSTTGDVFTRTDSLDYESKSQYDVSVTVTDSGGLSALLSFSVLITDENDLPSHDRNLIITVQSYREQSYGSIGTVEPADPDTVGNYSCSLITQTNIFAIGTGCLLSNIKTIPSSSSLTVAGSDGIHESANTYVTVNINEINNDTLSSAIVTRFQSITPSEFITNQALLNKLRGLASGMQTLEFISIRQTGEYLDVVMSLRNGDKTYSNQLANKIQSSRNNIESTGVSIYVVQYDVCQPSSCSQNGQCTTAVSLTSQLDFVSTVDSTITFHVAEITPHCECNSDWVGYDCSTQAFACSTRPCLNGASCQPIGETDYECRCTKEWEGDRCQTDINECSLPEKCQNGARCTNFDGGYNCECTENFYGRQCELHITCETRNPCLNGAQCINLDPGGYECKCKFGYYGKHCNQSSFGFSENSYLEFSPLAADNNSIEMTITTPAYSPDYLLFFQPGSTPNHFMSLLLINRTISFIYNTGETNPTIISGAQSGTGDWFKISAIRSNLLSSLTITNCSQPGSCQTCHTDDCRTTLRHDKKSALQTGNKPASVAGVDSLLSILPYSTRIHVASFTGCMANIMVDGKSDYTKSEEILNTCPVDEAKQTCQQSSFCGLDGNCIEDWFTARCTCPGFLSTSPCDESLIDVPVTFPADAQIMYKLRTSYRAETLLTKPDRKRRSISSESLFKISVRTGNNGIILSTIPPTINTRMEIDSGVLSYGTLSHPQKIADGSWHNVTLKVTSALVLLIVDGQTVNQTSRVDSDFLNAQTVEAILIGGEKFEGCMAGLSLNGDSLPMSDSITDKYEITIGSEQQLSSGCDGCPENINICAADQICSVNEGRVACVIATEVPPTGLAPWLYAVIIILALVIVFALILAAVFFTRYIRRKKNKAAKVDKGYSLPIVKMEESQKSNPSRLDGHENLSDADILASERPPSRPRSHTPKETVSPGLLKQMSSRTVPSPYQQLDDSTVIIEGSVTGTHNYQADLYEFNESASIAPSDVDIRKYYKGYRKGQEDPSLVPHHMRPPSRQTPQSMNKSRESPFNKQFGVNRQSPTDLNRQQETPISQLNQKHLRQTPIDELNRRIQLEKRIQRQDSESSMTDGSTIKQPHWQPAPRTDSRMSRQSDVTDSRLPTQNNPTPTRNNPTPTINNSGLNGLPRGNVMTISAQRQQDLNRLSHHSVSSSDEEQQRIGRTHMERNIYSEAADSSSDESSNDSFTASEFEPDEPKVRNDYQSAPQMMFTKLQEVEDESDTGDPNAYRTTYSWDALRNVTDGSSLQPYIHGHPASDTDNDSIAKQQKSNANKWDHLLTWGVGFEKLVGVCTDIAALPNDSETASILSVSSHPLEDYV